MKYKVVYESTLKSSRVLSLDKNHPIEDWDKTSIKVDNKIYPYHWTTSEYMIVVDSQDTFLDKEIEFV